MSIFFVRFNINMSKIIKNLQDLLFSVSTDSVLLCVKCFYNLYSFTLENPVAANPKAQHQPMPNFFISFLRQFAFSLRKGCETLPRREYQNISENKHLPFHLRRISFYIPHKVPLPHPLRLLRQIVHNHRPPT